jgi:hypothetical protein
MHIAGPVQANWSLINDAAVEWYRKAIAITREALSKTPDSVNFRWQNAARSLEFAEALKRADKPSEAVSQAQIERDTLIGLGVSQPARREFQRLLLASDCMLSDLKHRLGSSVSSLSYQNSAMDVLTSVRSGGPDLYVDQTLAGCYDVFSRVDSRRAPGWDQPRQLPDGAACTAGVGAWSGDRGAAPSALALAIMGD